MAGRTSGSCHDAIVVQCRGVALLDLEVISWWLMILVISMAALLILWELR